MTAVNSTAAPLASPPEPPTPRGPPRILFVMLGLVLAIAGVLGIRTLLRLGTERTDDATVLADIIPLSSRVNGEVAKVLVQENQLVQAGDLLVQLDERAANLEVARAEANLAIAKAQLQSASAEVEVVKAQASGGLRSAQASLASSQEQSGQVDTLIVSAQADVKRVQQELQRVTSELERVERLLAAGMVSQAHLDDARSAQGLAQATLARAQAQLQSVQKEKVLSASRIKEAQGRLDQSAASEAKVGMAVAAVELASARVEEAKQTLELARLNQSLLKIAAPRSGTVSRLVAHEGQFVEEGQFLLQLVPPTTMVVANFKETQLGQIQVGQRAEVLVDAYPDTPLTGTVHSIAGGTGASFSLLPANNASGNFVKVVQRIAVRIILSEPLPVPLKNGMSVEVIIHTR